MPSTDRLIKPLVNGIISRPGLVLAVFLIISAALGWQARNLRIDASADTLLMRGDPNYIRSQVVSRRFAPQEFLLIAYVPHDHPVLSERTFDDLRAISDKLRKLERVESVRSILNVPLFGLMKGGLTADIDPEAMTIDKQAFAPAELPAVLQKHPIYEDLLINRDQTATAIQVLFRTHAELEAIYGQIVDLEKQTLDGELSDQQRQELKQLKKQAEPIEHELNKLRTQEIEAIREMLSEYENHADLFMGGLHVLGYQLIRIIRNDLIVFGSGIAVMICVILLLVFGQLRWVIIPMVCCASSMLSTMGLFALLDFKTTVISSNFIALQLILTLAIVVHLIVQYRQDNAEHPEWEQARLVRETLRCKVAPCFYTGVTTSFGFGSLLLSRIRPVIAFGWMMVVAMLVSLVASLVLFPAMMALFPAKPAVAERNFSRRLLTVCANLTLNHPAMIGIAALVVLAAGLAGTFQLDVENSFLNYFRQKTRVHRELSFIDRDFGGSTVLDLTVDILPEENDGGLVLTAAAVQELQRIQHGLRQYEAIGKILSVVDFTELARDMNDGRPLTEYELTAIYWLMEDSLREDLVGSFLSTEHGQVRFNMRIQDTTEGLNRGELLAAIRRDMATLGIPEHRYMLTNLFVLYQDILQRLFRSQILTLGVVYAVLTLTFWAIFQSLKLALIGMVPNALSICSVLGVMGWLGIPLDLMTITIAAIAAGIAVDDTIHYIHRYREEKDNPSTDAMVRATHGSVGFALLYTSLIITLGFSLLVFSNFVPSVLFGLLTGLAMIVALVANLTVMPALLRKFA